MGELIEISEIGKYVSNTSSNFYFLTITPIKSLDPFQFLLGVTIIDLTFRYFVETTLIYTFLSSFSCMSSANPFLRVFLSCWRLNCAYTNGTTSTMKSKKGSTLPSNGLLTLIDRIRNPSPFCKNEPVSLVFPIFFILINTLKILYKLSLLFSTFFKFFICKFYDLMIFVLKN